MQHLIYNTISMIVGFYNSKIPTLPFHKSLYTSNKFNRECTQARGTSPFIPLKSPLMPKNWNLDELATFFTSPRQTTYQSSTFIVMGTACADVLLKVSLGL